MTDQVNDNVRIEIQYNLILKSVLKLFYETQISNH